MDDVNGDEISLLELEKFIYEINDAKQKREFDFLDSAYAFIEEEIEWLYTSLEK